MPLILRFIIAGLFFVAIAPVEASRLSIFTVHEPPGSFYNDNGELEGFSVDVVREIQKRLNDHTPIVILPEVRAIHESMKKANVVLFSFSRTPERENDYYWIMLLMRKPWVLYMLEDSTETFGHLDQAKTLDHIGVVRGDVRAKYLERSGFTNLELVTTHDQNIKKLLRNRVQALFYEPQGMALECAKLSIPITRFRAVYQTEPSEVYLIMTKNGTDLESVKAWENAADQIRQDGTFRRISETWSHNLNEEYGIVSEFADGALNFKTQQHKIKNHTTQTYGAIHHE